MSSGECIAENVIDAGHQPAVMVPKVVADFRAMLPAAAVCVCDNHSTDRLMEVARAAGAIARRELKPVAYRAVRAPGEERRRS